MYFDEVENILEGKNSFRYTPIRGANNAKLAEKVVEGRVANADLVKKRELENLSNQGWKSVLKNNFPEYTKNVEEVTTKDAAKASQAFKRGDNNKSILDNMISKVLSSKLKIGTNPRNKNVQERSQRAATFAMASQKGLIAKNIDFKNLPKRYYFKPTNGSIKPYGGIKGLDNIMKIDNKIYLIESKQTNFTQSIEVELLDFARACNQLYENYLPVICTISFDLPTNISGEHPKDKNNKVIKDKNGNPLPSEKDIQNKKLENFKEMIKSKFPGMKFLFVNKNEINRMIKVYKVSYIPEKVTKENAKYIIADINKTAGDKIVQ